MKLTVGWLSIISFVLNICFAGLSFYQYLDSKKQEEKIKTMLRTWQNNVEGIYNGLLSVSQNPKYFSSTIDMAQAVGVAANSARSLNEAIIQERFYTDSEVRVQKEKSQEETKRLLESFRTVNQKSGETRSFNSK